jgi:hypothetical protein
VAVVNPSVPGYVGVASGVVVSVMIAFGVEGRGASSAGRGSSAASVSVAETSSTGAL